MAKPETPKTHADPGTSNSGADSHPSQQNPPSIQVVSPASQPDELTQLRAKAVEYENDLKRLAAEFDNYQKRVVREKTQARLDGQAEVLRHFISFHDEMESALKHTQAATSSSDELHKGVELLHRKLTSLLSSAGVKEISGSGMPDPHLHEVMLRVPGSAEGQIAQVLRKGYRLNEHVLRAAQVSVYEGKKKEEKTEEKIDENEKEKQTTEKTEEKSE